jgi:hypothetical protein
MLLADCRSRVEMAGMAAGWKNYSLADGGAATSSTFA